MTFIHAADGGNGLHGQRLDDYDELDCAVAVEYGRNRLHERVFEELDTMLRKEIHIEQTY